MELNEIIGNNLKLLLSIKDISMREFAKMIDVTPATVSQWISGKKVPLLRRIDQICNIFFITRDDLLHPMTEDSYKEGQLNRQGTELFISLDIEKKSKVIGYMEALK